MMEARPNMIKKYNKPIFGLILGIVIPIAVFFLFYLIKYSGVEFMVFINSLMENNALIPVASLCVLPNLIPYFIFKKLDYWYAIKGIVFSVLIYTVIVLVLKFI